MAGSTQSAIKVARASGGYVFVLEGRCTALTSKVFHEFAIRCLENLEQTLFFDLSSCEYMDSTFLGCLVDLHKRSASNRCVLSASQERCRTLLGYTQLHQILSVIEQPPTYVEAVELPTEDTNSPEFARHVYECHRRLAEVDGPQQMLFRSIADKMEEELEDA